MSNPPTQTSTTLLARVAEGMDEEAGRAFVQAYTPLVATLARLAHLSTADADDVVQEVLMAAVDGLRRERYDRSQARFKAWLRGIIQHKLLKARATRRRPASGQSTSALDDSGVGAAHRSRGAPPDPRVVDLNQIPDTAPGPIEQFEAEFEKEWQKIAYEQALEQIRREIDPSTYQAFDLYVRKERPVGEVAKFLGISRNAVYIAKTRVLARLRDALAE